MTTRASDIADPIERAVAELLEAARIEYIHEHDDCEATRRLDFVAGSVFIECKAGHADRTADQIKRADDVILVQGYKAAAFMRQIASRIIELETTLTMLKGSFPTKLIMNGGVDRVLAELRRS